MAKLEKASFTFSQEGNCSGTTGISEELTIECDSSLGIDNDGGCFYVIRTEGWSFDSIEELQEILNRINKIIKNKENEN